MGVRERPGGEAGGGMQQRKRGGGQGLVCLDVGAWLFPGRPGTPHTPHTAHLACPRQQRGDAAGRGQAGGALRRRGPSERARVAGTGGGPAGAGGHGVCVGGGGRHMGWVGYMRCMGDL